MFGSRARRLEARISELEASAGGPSSHPPRVAASGGADPWGWWNATGVDRSTAMAVPTLAYIRQMLAGGVSAMPLERFRNNADQTVTKLDAGWCANPDPAPTIAPNVFWSWVIDDLFFRGRSTLIVLGRDATGFPVMFRRVMPGELTYDPETLAWGIFWRTQIWYMGVEIEPADVVVIDGPHEGICNYGGQLIQAALDLETNAATAASEPLPNIDLHQTGGEPLSTGAAQELVSNWKLARSVGATAYTPSNLEARPLGFSNTDQQMVEARQYMATQLARLAGVNPVLVSAAMGASSSYVYTNQADYRAAFLDDVLDPYLQAIEGRLSANDVTARGQFLEFDRDEFTRLPLLERVQVMVGAMRGDVAPEAVNQLAQVMDIDLALPSPTDAPLPKPDTDPATTAPPAPAKLPTPTPAPPRTPSTSLPKPPGG